MIKFLFMVMFVVSTVVANETTNFIAKYEGFSAKAYWDVDHYSIGFGTPAKSKSEVITREEGLKRLEAHVNANCVPYLSLVKVKLTTGQKAALLSFIYNNGGEAFKKSTLLKHINKGNVASISKEWMKWKYVTVNGKPKAMPGLLARRQAEVSIWMKG